MAIDDLSPKTLEAEKQRLGAFCKSIRKHQRALEVALDESFGGHLDEAEWRTAFDSSDPHEALRTMAVTGSHSGAVNGYVELLRAASGARLLGLLPHRRPHAEQVFGAVCEDGGLNDHQVALLHDVYVLEGRLEHASPDVDPDEVRNAVERMREELPALVESARDWLARHGVRFTAGA